MSDDAIKKAWQASKLHSIRKFLEGRWKGKYNQLVAEVGEHQPQPAIGPTTTWVGPTSPLTAEEIAAMTIPEFVEYLETWTPSDQPMVPSADGLGRGISADVVNRPGEYAANAELFSPTKLRPIYLSWLFHGLEQALRASATFDWKPVLQLAHQVMSGKDLTVPDLRSWDNDVPWESVKRHIASLIDVGFQQAESAIPLDQHEIVWEILEPLTHEPEPNLRYEAEYGGDNMDPFSMSINTARGKAVHALFRYAEWCDRLANLDVEADNQSHELPSEILSRLDRLLDPEQEPTLTIRSVLGHFTGTLAYLATDWLRRNLDRIYPPNDPRLLGAALEGYFSFGRVNGYMYKHFREIYVRGLDWAIEPETSKSHLRPKECFAGILMNTCWLGFDKWEDDNSLARRFFAEAGVKARASAIDFLCRGVADIPAGLEETEKMLERARTLYESRLSHYEQSDDKTDAAKELESFGFWFARSHFKAEWLVDTLKRTLALTDGELSARKDVLKQLATLAPDHPEECSDCLHSIIQGEDSSYMIDYWQEEIQAVLDRVRDTENQDAWSTCEITIHLLGEKGIYRFKDMLD